MITLPVRLGLRGAELGLRAGLAVAERAIDLLGEVVAPTANRRRSDRWPTPPSQSSPADQSGASESPPADQSGASESPPADQSPAPDSEGGDPRSAAPSAEQAIAEQDAIAAERPAPTPPEPPASPPSPISVPPEPAHADEEETLVQEVAEPGAEEGAGAEIHIAEPWDGYAQLKAPEVIDQLAGRDQAELAAVELYEFAHRKRQTVIDAAKRELRRADSGS
jgi:hypothetical protein